MDVDLGFIFVIYDVCTVIQVKDQGGRGFSFRYRRLQTPCGKMIWVSPRDTTPPF